MAQRQLYPHEKQWFQAQRSRAKQAFELGSAQSTYERDLSNRQAGWNRGDLIRNYSRQRESFSNPWNKRGMLNSGMYGQALQRYTGDHQRDLQRQGQANQWKNEGFDMAGDQLARVRDEALTELQNQEREYQNTLATILRGG